MGSHHIIGILPRYQNNYTKLGLALALVRLNIWKFGLGHVNITM